MGALKKLIGEVEVTKDLILLLVIGGLYALSIALSNTFVNVYLWKQTKDFTDLGIYNLTIVVFQPLAFILAGRWAKKIDRVIVLRLGVVFLALFYLCVLFIGQAAGQYLMVLGFVLGTGYGFYWLAFNVLTFEITEPETRDFFNGFLGILTSTAGMIGPIVAGFIISRMANFTGYTIIFVTSLCLFTVAVILSFSLKRRKAEGQFHFVRIINERKNNANWRRITLANVFQGFREGTFIFIISVLVFITTDSELALGTFGLINSATAFIVYYLTSRYIKKHLRKKAILIGGIILYLAIFFIVFDLTFTKLLIYGVIIAIGYPLVLVPYISLTFDIIGKAWKAAEMRIEYIVVREIFLNFGRMISILLFLIAVNFFNEEKSIPILISIIGLGHLFIYFAIRKINLTSSDDSNTSARSQNVVDNESGSS